MSVYREAPAAAPSKAEHVQISRTTTIRRALIDRVLPDGRVLRTDGLFEQGDSDRLREAGLL